MHPKQVFWVGSSRKDIKKFPDEVKSDIGTALYWAQLGSKHPDSKMLKGFSGVYEIVTDHNTDTYRTVYVVNIGDHIYVLHAFQKKSKKGIKTPKKEVDIIKSRLNIAKEHIKNG